MNALDVDLACHSDLEGNKALLSDKLSAALQIFRRARR